jgi:PDDEXK-like domain of unknown function (DUF3799)
MSTEVQTCGELTGWTAEEYHANLTMISRSMLADFRANSAYFNARYIAGTIPAPKPTPQMELGTLVHTLVLQPEMWERLKPTPKVDKRTTHGREVWNNFMLVWSEDSRYTIVDGELYEQAKPIAAAVLAHDEASQLLALEGPTEHAVFWTDEETGLKCKSLRDKATPGILIDLKTSKDASPLGFAKAADNFGYDSQAQFYSEGHFELTGERCLFYFIAVETSPPFSVGVHQLDEAWLEAAAEENHAALRKLAKAFDTNDWLPVWSKGGANVLQRPRYANYKSQYEEDV